MVDISKEIDFSEIKKQHKGIDKFLSQAAVEIYENLQPEDKFKKPYIERDFSDYIIVCGLPQVDREKYEKLQGFLIKKIFPKIKITDDLRSDPAQPRLWGWNADKTLTNGCLILDFKNPQLAEYAINGDPSVKDKTGLNGLVFDKKHTLIAFSFADYSKVFNNPDQFVAPKLLEQKELTQWQQGTEEHFAVQNGQKVYLRKIFHLTKEPVSCLGKLENNDDAFIELQAKGNKIQWSPQGSYLVEIQEQGFQLYGGSKLEKLNFYPHVGVKNVEFSNNEQYIISYNGTVIEAVDSDNYIVWNVNEVQKKRTFKSTQEDSWGSLKFNHNSTLVARMTNHTIHVYQLPLMKLLPDSQNQELTPIIVKNIQYFQWVNNKNMILVASYAGNRDYDASEVLKAPTKLALIELPSRNVISWKYIASGIQNIEVVSDAFGNYVVAVMKKYSKNKRVFSTLLHVANIQKKGQTEIFDYELPIAEEGTLKSFSLENTKGKLALVNEIRAKYESKVVKTDYNIHLFSISTQRQKQTLKIDKLPIIKQKKTPEVQWSSNGEFFTLLNKDKESSAQGIMEVGFLSKNKEKTLQAEVFKSYDNLSYMTYASWDKTGRMIINGSENTNTYHIYDGMGEKLFQETMNKDGLQFCEFRPRNLNILPIDEQVQITNSITDKEKWKFWLEEDTKITNRKQYEEEQLKKKQEKEIKDYLAAKLKVWQETKAERIKLRGFDEENFENYYDETIKLREEVIETGFVEQQQEQQDQEESD